MPSRHSEGIKNAVRGLLVEGCSIIDIARKTGLSPTTVTRWRDRDAWSPKKTPAGTPIKTEDVPAGKIVSRGEREVVYDEKMHQLAYSISVTLAQLSGDELLAKADKIASLVKTSREILGRGTSGRGKPSVSIGILSTSPVQIMSQGVDTE